MLKACEQCADQLRLAQAELQLLRSRLEFAEAREKLKDERITDLQAQAAFWKEAAATRKEANELEQKRDTVAEAQVRELRVQNTDLKEQVAEARRRIQQLEGDRFKWGAGGAILGFGTCLGVTR